VRFKPNIISTRVPDRVTSSLDTLVSVPVVDPHIARYEVKCFPYRNTLTLHSVRSSCCTTPSSNYSAARRREDGGDQCCVDDDKQHMGNLFVVSLCLNSNGTARRQRRRFEACRRVVSD